jgi:hypothetical protein
MFIFLYIRHIEIGGGLLHNIFSITYCRVLNDRMRHKYELERSRCGLTEGTTLAFVWRGHEKPARIAYRYKNHEFTHVKIV